MWWDQMTSWGPSNLNYSMIYDFRGQTAKVGDCSMKTKEWSFSLHICLLMWLLLFSSLSFSPPLQSNLAGCLNWDFLGRGEHLWEMEVSWQVWWYLVSLSCSETMSGWVKDFPPSTVRNQKKESQILRCSFLLPMPTFGVALVSLVEEAAQVALHYGWLCAPISELTP